MSAYILFTREATLDQAELDTYHAAAPATVQGHTVKPLVFYGSHEDLEGSPTEATAMFEFPSMAEAKAWYESPAYRTVREHRFRGARYRVLLLEGV